MLRVDVGQGLHEEDDHVLPPPEAVNNLVGGLPVILREGAGVGEFPLPEGVLLYVEDVFPELEVASRIEPLVDLEEGDAVEEHGEDEVVPEGAVLPEADGEEHDDPVREHHECHPGGVRAPEERRGDGEEGRAVRPAVAQHGPEIRPHAEVLEHSPVHGNVDDDEEQDLEEGPRADEAVAEGELREEEHEEDEADVPERDVREELQVAPVENHVAGLDVHAYFARDVGGDHDEHQEEAEGSGKAHEPEEQEHQAEDDERRVERGHDAPERAAEPAEIKLQPSRSVRRAGDAPMRGEDSVPYLAASATGAYPEASSLR